MSRCAFVAALMGATAFAATVLARGGHGGGHSGGHGGAHHAAGHGGAHHGAAHHSPAHHGEAHHGEAHHSAEHHGTEHHSSQHHSKQHTNSHHSHQSGHHGWRHDAQGWVNGRRGALRPFSPEWYAAHPGAWRYRYLSGGLWGWAGLDTLNAWLGWNASNDNVTAPVVVEPTINDNSPAVAANYAGSESASGENQPNGDWLPLGVFALESPNKGGEQLVQIAVRRDGTLAGVAYSKGSEESSNLTGQVDRQTNAASWTVDANQKTSYAAPLKTLTSGEGPVTVTLADGEQQTWSATRLKQPTE